MAHPLPESKVRARRKRRARFLLILGAVLLLAVLGGLIYLSWRPFVRIGEVRIEGAQTVATSTLEKFVRERLAGTYLGIFPRDNVLLYSKGRIERDLRAEYPVFAMVSVAAGAPTTLVVAVSERSPAQLWCGTAPEAPQPCLYLDESGAAYAQAPSFSGSPYVRYYGALAPGNFPRQFLDPEKTRSLFALVEAMEEKAAAASEVSVEGNGDVSAVFAHGFTVKFSLAEDAGKVFERFSLALGSAPFSSHKLSYFEYLDLRFGDKLYYKLK